MKLIGFIFLFCFIHFVNLSQTKANKLVVKGNDYFDKMDYLKAEEFYNKALAIDSNCIEAFIQKSDISIQKSDFSNALTLIEKAFNMAVLNNSKNELVAHINSVRAFIYFNLNNYTSAIKDLNSAIALNDQNPSYFYMRALIKRMNSDIKGCCSDLKKASSLGLEKANDSLTLYCK
jgi:tetratricopeptide (TPR) repeat protein